MARPRTNRIRKAVALYFEPEQLVSLKDSADQLGLTVPQYIRSLVVRGMKAPQRKVG